MTQSQADRIIRAFGFELPSDRAVRDRLVRDVRDELSRFRVRLADSISEAVQAYRRCC